MKNKYIFLFGFAIISSYMANATELENADSSNFYLLKAKEQKAARRVWEAEKSFQKAIAFDPQNEAARLEFAAYYCDQRKYSLALQQYNMVLQKKPNHSLSLSKMVDLNFLLRKWEDVIKYADQAVKMNLKIDKLNYMVGKSYYEDENYGLAKKHLVLQMNETPSHKETVALLGRVYVELSNYAEAINTYSKVLETSPDNVDIMYEMALLYSAQKRDREAVKYFEMAAAKGIKQDIAFLENMANSYLEFDVEKGVEVMNKVLLKKPGDIEILTQIGMAYYHKEQYTKAFDFFYKIYLADNKNAKALYMSGLATIKSGDKKKGAYICDQAIAIDPSLGQLKSSKSIL